ncbi:MAG: aspartate-semialdehyde dehydrogenase [Clostridia bacterium]|nr:aspartate-semialdehyde dehydrogenase [Clostridia bacterium]
MKSVKIGVVGATGLVGQTMLRVLRGREGVRAYAPDRHEGEVIEGRKVLPLSSLRGDDLDVCLLAVGADVAEVLAPKLASEGCVVVDNSSRWRQDPKVPLVVPEVNPEDLMWHRGIVANPNCSTIQAVVALGALKRYGIERVEYHTYQAVSGAGKGGIADLKEGTATTLPHPIRDNVIPSIDLADPSGYTKEEIKMREETRKILHASTLPVAATCVRVPVLNGHTVAVTVRLKDTPSLEEVREALSSQTVVMDDLERGVYPMPILATGQDEVLVGRVRKDPDDPHLYRLVTVDDNLRKGAATNAVEILDLLVKNGLLHE